MVRGIDSTYSYNGNTYERRSQIEAEAGFWLATFASAAMYKALPPFSNPFLKQIVREHSNNYLYKDIFKKAVDKSGLREKGLSVKDMFFNIFDKALPKGQVDFYDVKAGLNAFFSPETKAIYLNENLASITGFHELGHAMNNMSSKFGKILQKARKPGYLLAGAIGFIALTSRPKPKDAPKNTFDKIQDNCALIAFAGMLPTVAEEALASHKGIKMAREAGLSDALVKNLKKFYGKALLSYAGHAVLTGLSVFIASKITELFTRPKKIN